MFRLPSSKEFFIAIIFSLCSLHFLFLRWWKCSSPHMKNLVFSVFCWIFKNFIASQIFGDALRVWVFQALFHPSQKFVVRNLDGLSKTFHISIGKVSIQVLWKYRRNSIKTGYSPTQNTTCKNRILVGGGIGGGGVFICVFKPPPRTVIVVVIYTIELPPPPPPRVTTRTTPILPPRLRSCSCSIIYLRIVQKLSDHFHDSIRGNERERHNFAEEKLQ